MVAVPVPRAVSLLSCPQVAQAVERRAQDSLESFSLSLFTGVGTGVVF